MRVFFFFTLLFSLQMYGQQWNYPIAPKSTSLDTFFNVAVPDEYKALEDINNSNTQDWLNQEQQVTTSYFRKTSIDYFLDAEIASINYKSNIARRSGNLFFKYLYVDENETPSVYYSNKLVSHSESTEELIYNNVYNSDFELLLSSDKFKGTDKVNFGSVFTSGNDSLVAFFYGKKGSDWKEIGIIEPKSKRILEDHIEGVKTTNLQWDENGFYYSRFDSIDKINIHLDRPAYEKIFYHKLGTLQQEDEVVFWRNLLPDELLSFQISDDRTFLIVKDYNSKSEELSIYYKDLKKGTTFFPLVRNTKDKVSIIGNKDTLFYAFTNVHGASNNLVVEININNPTKWEKVIGESEKYYLSDAVYFDDQFLLLYQADDRQYLRLYNLHTNTSKTLQLDKVAHFELLSSDIGKGKFIFVSSSIVCPPIGWFFDANKFTLTVINKTIVDYDPAQYTITHLMYPSLDNTLIPMMVVYKKGTKLNSSAPCLLEAYGGYGVYPTPHYKRGLLSFLNRGGVYAFANVRGGQYSQKDWHKMGMGLNKQNTIDDFYAAAKYLVENKFTNPHRLAITGSSHGGLLVAACVNQHPEMFRAAIPKVGVYDLLHFDKYTVGVHSVAEFGDITQEKYFNAMFKYSPLHNIKRDVDYPAMLIMASSNDDRVPMLHSLKYIAALQENVKRSHPILLRIEKDAGHYGAQTWSTQKNAERDFYAFLFKELGIKY
jgi:prolyl oligopeptidase